MAIISKIGVTELVNKKKKPFIKYSGTMAIKFLFAQKCSSFVSDVTQIICANIEVSVI